MWDFTGVQLIYTGTHFLVKKGLETSMDLEVIYSQSVCVVAAGPDLHLC